MKAVKVFIRYQGELRSFNIDPAECSGTCREFSIRYREDGWTYPKTGQFFAFKDEHSAFRFVNRYRPLYAVEIWEIEANKIYNAPKFISAHTGTYGLFWDRAVKDGDSFREPEDDYDEYGDPIYVMETPQGTVLCDSVKLIRPLMNYEQLR
jgi:hypothetical protein